MSVRKRAWITRKGEKKTAWVVDYVDQTGARHVATFAQKKDAEDYRATVKVDVRTGVHTAPSNSITVAQAAEDWIAGVELEGRERARCPVPTACRPAHQAAPRPREARHAHNAAHQCVP